MLKHFMPIFGIIFKLINIPCLCPPDTTNFLRSLTVIIKENFVDLRSLFRFSLLEPSWQILLTRLQVPKTLLLFYFIYRERTSRYVSYTISWPCDILNHNVVTFKMCLLWVTKILRHFYLVNTVLGIILRGQS